MLRFKKVSEEEKTLEAMEQFGGSFVKSLVQIYVCADPENKVKLLDTFGNYFFKYYNGEIKAATQKKKPILEVTISMTESEDEKTDKVEHHVSVVGIGSKESLEHAFTHLLIDGDSIVGKAIDHIIEMGKPLTEAEAKDLLGSDMIELIKIKIEKKVAEEERELPN